MDDYQTPFQIRYNHEFEIDRKNIEYEGSSILMFFKRLGSKIKSSFATKKLFIGPRYIIMGTKIIYFQNVTKIQINESNIKLYDERQLLYIINKEKIVVETKKTQKRKDKLNTKFELIKTSLLSKIKKNNPSIAIEEKLVNTTFNF